MLTAENGVRYQAALKTGVDNGKRGISIVSGRIISDERGGSAQTAVGSGSDTGRGREKGQPHQ